MKLSPVIHVPCAGKMYTTILRTEKVVRDKEGHCVIIEGSVFQKYITIYIYMHLTIELEAKIDGYKRINRDIEIKTI